MLFFVGRLAHCISQFYDMPESSSRTVKFVWADRTGKKDPSYSVELGHTPVMASHGLNDGPFTALWYSVGPITKNFTLLDEAAGISRFWFEIDEGDGSATRNEDQGGLGFALPDTIMVSATSCTDNAVSAMRLDVAVRSSFFLRCLHLTDRFSGSYVCETLASVRPLRGSRFHQHPRRDWHDDQGYRDRCPALG